MDFQVKQRDQMSRRDRISFVALVLVYLAAVVYYAVWWFRPQHLPMNWSDWGYFGLALDSALFICLSFIFWRGIILNLFAYWAVSPMKVPIYEPPQPELKVAMITCFVPGKEPIDVLEKTLRAMKRASYPHDTWVLDEGDDPAVKALCRQLDVKHFSRKDIGKYNQQRGKFRIRTKSGNLNAWLDSHGQEYELVAQMDVDFVPKPHFLERTLGYFRDPKVAFVGMPQNHGNQDENWIAKGAAEQVYMFYGPIQKGLYGRGMQMLIGGIHVLRTEAWRDIDGYSESVTEDHITGMKVYARGWKSVFVPEVLSVGEVPADMLTYLGQQMRWAYGLLDILIKYTPGLIGKLNWTQRIGYLNLQAFYLFGLGHFLSVVLVSLYLMFGITPTALVFTDWVLHAAPPFLINIVAFRWLQKFNIEPDKERGYLLKGALLFFAAWPAVFLGLFHAVMRHRLFYNITRKGSPGRSSSDQPSLRILIPFLISATISLAGLVAFPVTGFNMTPMVFWAALNLSTMTVVVLTMWKPPLPAPAPIRLRALRRAFPTALATATTASVLFASVSVPSLLDITPYNSLMAATRQSATMKPVVASFLEPGSRSVAIGTLAYSRDELEEVSKISHQFINWQPEQLQMMVYAIRRAAANDQIAMITWQPTFLVTPDPNLSPTRPERSILQRILRGELDAYIAQTADILKSTGQPILLRFAHEMDIPDDGIHPWSRQPPDLYIAAYQYVHGIFEARQADNVRWVWSPAGHWEQGRFISLDWYPGDKFVDLIGLTSLVYWQWEEWNEERKATHAYRSPAELIGINYDQISQLGKPVVLAEVGVDLHPERNAEQKEWIRAMFELVRQEQYTNIVAIVFFDLHAPFGWEADWSLNREEMKLVIDTIKADEFFELLPSPKVEQLRRQA